MSAITSLPYFGESLSLFVAILWTTSALFSEVATKRLGASVVNVWRMVMSMTMISLLLWAFTGSPLPPPASFLAWMWLLLSGLVGYVFGDYCLFNAYHLIGSRFAQLFMTIAPATAALAGWIFMGQTISFLGILGMTITSLGIALSILGRAEKRRKATPSEDAPTLSSSASGNVSAQYDAARENQHSIKAHQDSCKENSSTLGSVQLKLPIRGVLYGIGAAVGQGLGLVLSAKGLLHYDRSLQQLPISPEQLGTYKALLPFAATFIRGVAGLIGFTLLLVIAQKTKRFTASLRDARGLSLLACAVVFGPFVGVSLSLMATRHTTTGIAMTLMSLSPILILWPTHLLFGQRITRQEVLGACISVLGVALIFFTT